MELHTQILFHNYEHRETGHSHLSVYMFLRDDYCANPKMLMAFF